MEQLAQGGTFCQIPPTEAHEVLSTSALGLAKIRFLPESTGVCPLTNLSAPSSAVFRPGAAAAKRRHRKKLRLAYASAPSSVPPGRRASHQPRSVHPGTPRGTARGAARGAARGTPRGYPVVHHPLPSQGKPVAHRPLPNGRGRGVLWHTKPSQPRACQGARGKGAGVSKKRPSSPSCTEEPSGTPSRPNPGRASEQGAQEVGKPKKRHALPSCAGAASGTPTGPAREQGAGGRKVPRSAAPSLPARNVPPPHLPLPNHCLPGGKGQGGGKFQRSAAPSAPARKMPPVHLSLPNHCLPRGQGKRRLRN